MKKLIGRYLLLFLLLVGISTSDAQVNFNCAIDSNHMLIGDQRLLYLKIVSNEPISIDSIDFGYWTELGVEVLENQNWQRQSATIFNEQLRIGVFDTGYIKLPPLPLMYGSQGKKDTAYSNDLALEVDGIVLDSTGLAPIKPILKEPITLRDFIPYLIAFGIGSALIALILLRRKRLDPEPTVVVIPDPPHEVALRDLDKLKQSKLWQQGKIKQYQSELTHIIRAYLEDRFKVPALESTTNEILSHLKAKNINPSQSKVLDEILNMADLIKFAKAKPDVNIHSLFMDKAEDFVLTTKEEAIEDNVEA